MDHKRKTWVLIDMSVPTDNISYRDLEIEIEKMWHFKIVGALGMIKKSTDKHINKILGCPNL